MVKASLTYKSKVAKASPQAASSVPGRLSKQARKELTKLHDRTVSSPNFPLLKAESRLHLL